MYLPTNMVALLYALLGSFFVSVCIQNGYAYPAEKMIKSGDSEFFTDVLNPTTLIVVENADDNTAYSAVLEMLTHMGHKLTIRTAAEVSQENFRQLDEFVYDNLILLTDTIELDNMPKESISVENIKRFVDEGKNVVMTTTSSAHLSSFSLMRQMGVDSDPRGSVVSDAFSPHSADTGENVRFNVNGATEMAAFLGVTRDTSILFEGIGHFVPDTSRTQVLPILTGNPTSFSHNIANPDKTYNTGKKIGLVSAMQALNYARVVMSGSKTMFSNQFFEWNSANKEFVRNLLEWACGQKGIIRWSQFKHHKVGEQTAPYMYTVNDMVNVQVDLNEYDGKLLKPYKSDDVQIEFVMLDPHIRIFLKRKEGTSTYSAVFKAPDKYGIFKFVLEHKRIGYNHLHLESVAPLRNFKHNDYERFIWCASPYYAAAFCSMLSVLIIAYVFLYHSKQPVKQE